MGVDYNFCMRSNSKLYELINVIDVVLRNNIKRLLWHSHVVRMKEDTLARWVFDAEIRRSR